MQQVSEEEFQPLFRIEGEPLPPIISRGGREKGLESMEPTAKGRSLTPSRTLEGRRGTIPTTSANKINHFSIGLPVVHPLNRLHAAMGTAIAPDIQHLLDHYEFFWIQLACSFRAAEGYHFENAQFQVSFQTEPIESGMAYSPAIAYDLYPRHLEDECNVNTKIGITPELKLSYASIEAQIGLPALEHTTSGNAYQSRIEAFGLQEETAGWLFKSTAFREMSGTYRLYVLLRKPGLSQVKATFQLNATVRKKGGPVQALLMRSRSASGELIDVLQHVLC